MPASLEHKHPLYNDWNKKWTYTTDVYTGAYADAKNLSTYLKQKWGEHDDNYTDRQENVSPNLLLTQAFGSIIGQLFGSASEFTIDWGDLGDPEEPGTRAYQITHNTDGKGTNLDVWRRKLVASLLQFDRFYPLADGPTEKHGPVCWRIIEPGGGWDWEENKSGLTYLKYVTNAYERSSPDEKQEDVQTYRRFVLDPDTDAGTVTVWKKRPNEDEPVLMEEETQTFKFVNEEGMPVLPIFIGGLLLDVYVGYYLARQAVSIFNGESDRDNLLRNANHPKGKELVSDPKVATANSATMAAGGNWFVGEPDDIIDYFGPPTEHLQTANETLEKKRNMFSHESWQAFNDQAKASQQTATEIDQDATNNQRAILTLIAASHDEIINQELYRTEQIEFPGDPNKWGKAKGTRTGSFRPQVPEDTKKDKALERVERWDALGVPLQVALVEGGVKTEEEAAVFVGNVRVSTNGIDQ